jgi:Ca2+-binding RTX toxin-like protein
VITIHAGAPLVVNGNAGEDTITIVSSKAMTVSGGGDNDVIDTSGGTGGGLLFGDLGDDSIHAGGGNDTISGGAGDDTINDAGGSNSIDAGAGDDSVLVAAGSNTIHLGEGDNLLTVSAGGNDTIDGGTGDDSVSLLTQAGKLDSLSLGDGDNTVTVSGTTINVGVTTGAGNDLISISTTGEHTVTSGAGGDSIIVTGAGNDSISAGDGADTITVTGATTSNVDAGAGNDVILGSANNDTINGGAGDDAITGNAGKDILTGGTGKDTFNFAAGDSNAGVATDVGKQDQITDWEGGTSATPVDMLHFAGLGVVNAGNHLQTYVETTAADYGSALTAAGNAFSQATPFQIAVVQVGNDTIVFANNGGTANALDATDTAVVLVGRTLNDIDFTNIG